MSQLRKRPEYNLSPIRSISALARALKCTETTIHTLSLNSDRLYRKAKPQTKSDGSIRQPFDALPRLKAIQIRIKEQILKRVNFPSYLTGSVIGKDYRTNAGLHISGEIVICEDIKSFFPSISAELVYHVWHRLFRFSDDVAHMLTGLTTMNGFLPEGAVTSSYLANLVLWDSEAVLHEELASRGIVYSRYVDDITVSSKSALSNDEKTQVIAKIYGMLASHGLKANRRKHEIMTSGGRMFTTKLIVNKRVALPKSTRQNIRAGLFQLERRVISGERGNEINTELNRVTSRVGQLGKFHPTRAAPLKVRLKALRQTLEEQSPTQPKDQEVPMPLKTTASDPPPWD